MRAVLGILVLAATLTLPASLARAEITKLGGFTLGQEVKKPATVKVTVFGCAGELRPEIDRQNKVTSVRFSTDECKSADAVVATIAKELGGSPIVNAQGDKLWEGKTASLIFSTSLSASAQATILLVPPGPGSKRTCWADDGFAAFWTGFKAAVASGKPAAVATSFAFPIKDFEGKVQIKNAKAFAARLARIIGDDDARAIAAGELTAHCQLDDDSYRLPLSGTNSELGAKKIGGAWLWSSVDAVSPD
jgi:hypothetical protein